MKERADTGKEPHFAVGAALAFGFELDAYAGYLAALDREERAARVYAEQIKLVRRHGLTADVHVDASGWTAGVGSGVAAHGMPCTCQRFS